SLRVANLLEVGERGICFRADSLLPFAKRAVRQRFVVAHAAFPNRPCNTFLSFALIASSMSAHCCIIFVRSGRYCARLYAARTLLRSAWASWRSITSGAKPHSFRIVDAVERNPCPVAREW